MLYVFAGLPGVGKSELAKDLAEKQDAVYLRIDTIEQALRDGGKRDIAEEGYLIAYRLAEDNLKLRQNVVADCVNPIALTRNAWLRVAERTGSPVCTIELTCSDKEEHRARVETRPPDVPNLEPLPWRAVVEREYDPWLDADIHIDTANRSAVQSKAELAAALTSFLFHRSD